MSKPRQSMHKEEWKVSISRHLTLAEKTSLRNDLRPLLVGKAAEEYVEDLVEYCCALISNKKTINHVVEKLLWMDFDFLPPSLVVAIALKIQLFLISLPGSPAAVVTNAPSDIKSQNNDEHMIPRLLSLKSGLHSALASRSGDSSRKSFRQPLSQDSRNKAANSTDILTLNVGGERKIQVQRRTLTRYRESLLATKFAGPWTDERDADGHIFINHPPEIFIPLINFLRDKETETPGFLVPSPSLDDFGRDEKLFVRFQGLVEYYGLTKLLYPIRILQVSSSTAKVAPIPFDSKGVTFTNGTATKLPTTFFYLQSPNPNHRIKSFQIRINDDRRGGKIYVGWADPTRLGDWPYRGERKYRLGFQFNVNQVPSYCLVVDCNQHSASYSVPGPLLDGPSREEKFASVPKTHVAIFGGTGTWRLENVELEEFANEGSLDEQELLLASSGSHVKSSWVCGC